jgi:type IV pilus assembly protein PilE
VNQAHFKSLGFSLLELMVTVTIAAILAAIAIPNYIDHVRRAHRSDATAALLTIQTAQEKSYLQYGRYAVGGELSAAPTATTPGLNIATTTTSGLYTLAITSASAGASDFTATATATGSQANDTKCVTLIVDSTGAKISKDSGGVATTECWTK